MKVLPVAAGVLLVAVILWLAGFWNPVTANDGSRSPAAPEFTHADASDWINSPPLKLAELRGKVVMLDIWSYGCWNCYRSFPWLKSVEKRFESAGLKVIGVHTPEFDHEKVRSSVEAKVTEFGLPHPVMLDSDFSYWKALGNRYWPPYYLIDKQGRLRARFIGETHADTDRARQVEAATLSFASPGPGISIDVGKQPPNPCIPYSRGSRSQESWRYAETAG